MEKQTLAGRSGRYAVALVALLMATLPLLASCQPDSAVELAPFKEMARAGGCADIRNHLFLIDDQLVFWDRAGNCADAAYGQTLYGSTPDQALCTLHDSIAGPVKKCEDAQYQEMFDTMTGNLDKPDLGLGSGHTVQAVRF